MKHLLWWWFIPLTTLVGALLLYYSSTSRQHIEPVHEAVVPIEVANGEDSQHIESKSTTTSTNVMVGAEISERVICENSGWLSDPVENTKDVELFLHLRGYTLESFRMFCEDTPDYKSY